LKATAFSHSQTPPAAATACAHTFAATAERNRKSTTKSPRLLHLWSSFRWVAAPEVVASEAEEVSAEAPPVEEALLEAGRKQLKRRKTNNQLFLYYL